MGYRDVIRSIGRGGRERKSELVERHGRMAVRQASKQPDVQTERIDGETWFVHDNQPNRGYADDDELFGGAGDLDFS